MIIKYYDIFLKSIEGSNKSLQSYNQTAHWIGEYGKEKGVKLNFKNMDTRFYNEFWRYFVEGKGYAPNTFGKHIKHIKAFMKWSYEEGLHDNKDWRKFRITNQACGEPALNSEELKRLYALTLDFDEVISHIESEEKIRLDFRQKNDRYKSIHKHFNCMIALCSSGMYPNDLLNFTKENIIEGRYVKYKRHKETKGFREPWCIFPYVDDDIFHFVDACESVNYKFDFSMKNLYRDIRVLLSMAGIDKQITPRSFRKTFVTIWYFERGLDMQNAMKMTGHSRETSFRHYLNIDDEIIINNILEKKPMIKARRNKVTPIRKAI